VVQEAGDGDGGLFKGILARYLGELVAVSGDESTRAVLIRNAAAAWANRRTGLVGPSWSRPPRGPVELSAHLSGVLLLQAVAGLPA
jgi:predicted alpha-1,6-mannanase (GH76 family)